MDIIYSDMPIPTNFVKSVFLAGPTPRKKEVKSWRPEAIKLLSQEPVFEKILIPERKDWSVKFEYTDQVKWEYECMTRCSIIMMWLPRQIPDMMGLTSNVEFGLFVKDDRFVYGRPNEAVHCKYLDWAYKKYASEIHAVSLEETIADAESRYFLLYE